MKPIADYPRVVEVEGITDAGEGGGTSCPHCGAEGRYITWFITEDGVRRGAMAGCFKLFPKSRYAAIVATILEKERDYARAGRQLASWDRAILDAIRRLPELGAARVDAIIATEDGRRRAYISSRYGGRRR